MIIYLNDVYEAIEQKSCRSAWDKGVKEYALEFVEFLDNALQGAWIDPDDLMSRKLVMKYLLNGAMNWEEYSWGGCSLIYDADIAERLCTPSELKRTKNGQLPPSRDERWLDVQARALHQASWWVADEISEKGWVDEE